MLVFTNKLPLWQSLASGPQTKLLGCFYDGPKTYSLFPPSFLNNEAVTFYRAVCIGEWAEMAWDTALLWLEGAMRAGERAEEVGASVDPGWTQEGVWALWAEGNDTWQYFDSITWSCWIESTTPASQPSLSSGLASLKTPQLGDSEPLPRSQRLEKEKGAKKRAMKEFLFSKKGNVPRDVVNIKPQGQAQED